MQRLCFLGFAFSACLTAAAGTAGATEIKLSLPGEAQVERATVDYDCGEAGTLKVEYVNADEVSLAVFTYGGEAFVAANVLSASGARYAAGPYVWWSKGKTGSLYDLREGEDSAPVAECTEAQ